MITIKLKRLYNGIASLRAKSADHNRDEQYDKAIKAGGCKVVVVDRIMTLSRAVLEEKKFQVTTKLQTSRYGGQPYRLYDFRFVDDPKKKEDGQGELF